MRPLRVGVVALGTQIALFELATGVAALAALSVGLSAAMGLFSFGAPVNASLYSVLGSAGVGEAHTFRLYNLGFSAASRSGRRAAPRSPTWPETRLPVCFSPPRPCLARSWSGETLTGPLAQAPADAVT